MLDFLKKRPMLLCAVAASAVSVITLYSERALFILALLILALIFLFIYKRVKGELIFATILILCVTVSAFFMALKADSVKYYDEVACSGEFIVVDTPQNHGEYFSATLETVESNLLDGGEKVAVTYRDGNFEFSQIINADIVVTSFEGTDYKTSNFSNGIFLKAYIKDFEYTGKNDAVLSVVNSIRKYIKHKIFKNYSADTAATVMALVAGDRTYFSEQFYSNVKNAGIAHVMVVSGMHLSVMVSLFLYLSNKFFYNRYLKAITILFVTVAVMAICGFTMSIQRAGITYIIMALGLVLDRENTPENTLGLAVTVILLINPFAIFNVAFQLSVLSTFAILVVAVPVTEFVSRKGILKNKFLLSIFSSVVISLSTMLFTAPVAVNTFGYLSTVSIITNLLIATPSSAAMIFCVLGFVLPFLSVPLFYVSEVITGYINTVINYFGSLSFATADMPQWTVILLLAAIIIILWALLACKVRSDMLKLKEIRNKKLREGGKKAIGSTFGAGIKKRG